MATYVHNNINIVEEDMDYSRLNGIGGSNEEGTVL